MFKKYDTIGIALEVGGIAGMISSGSVYEMIHSPSPSILFTCSIVMYATGRYLFNHSLKSEIKEELRNERKELSDKL